MSDWSSLEDMDTQATDPNVQYVGVVETNEEPAPPVQVPRRPVQRVAPRPTGRVVAPAGGAQQPMPIMFFPTPTGAQVALNAEAAQNMAQSRVHDVGGKSALRIQPGTYVVVVPGRGQGAIAGSGNTDRDFDRAERRRRGMGTETDDLFDELARTGGGTSTRTSGAAAFDWVGLIGGLGRAATGIATAVVGGQERERQYRLDWQRQQAEIDAAAAARQTAAQQAAHTHRETLARIQSGQEQLDQLRQQQTQTQTSEQVVSSGMSPIVWVVIALVAAGGIGGLVWLIASKKKAG